MQRSKQLEELAASVLMIGFPGESPNEEMRDFIARGLSGAILFRRNVSTPRQVFELCRELKSAAGERPFLCGVDQEGGRVARLREGFTELPPMRTVGQLGNEPVAEALGSVIGEECRAVGFDLDFAPVLDVDTNPDNPVIGDRSFGPTAELCAAMGSALSRGIQSHGVAACGKHLPGHGDTRQDSHLALPVLPHGWERLEAVELLPFRRAVAAGLASVMTAHVVFPALDPDLPVTLSPKALGEVRRRVGLDAETGALIISDDLEMAAVIDRWDLATAAPLAIAAGCDLLLVCGSGPRKTGPRETLEALCKYGESTEGRGQLERAQRRVRRFAREWGRSLAHFEPERLRRPEALRLVERLGVVAPAKLPDPTERA
jgi:beta-N-acetylhexosaminidase